MARHPDAGAPDRGEGGRIRAVLPDNETARTALASLEHRGLDASSVHFDERTQRRAASSPESGHRDERFLDQVGSRWSLGLVVGAVAGAVIGALAGAAFFGFEGRAALLAALAFGIGLGAAGAGLGVFAGGVWGQQQSAAWEETFEAPGLQGVTLLVDVTTDEEMALASGVLREYSDEVEITEGGP